MTPQDIGALISIIGLLTQAGGAVLLAALFAMLLRAYPQHPYFRLWTWGWLAMMAALAAVGTLYLRASVPLFRSELAAGTAELAYQVAKVLFYVCLAGGTLSYVAGVPLRRFARWALPPAMAYAVGTGAWPGLDLNEVMLLQSPAAAGTFGLCAALLLRLPPSRSSLGSRATGVVLGFMAALWLVYGVALTEAKVIGAEPLPGALSFVLQYNSYFDLLAQMLLGFGMVLLLLEDARREADDARAQLAVAHDQLRRVALYDPLTGALNRRAYDEGVGLDAVGARFGTAMMVDMDNLKHVNDAHGHAAGDELLRRTVDTLRGCIRPLDRVYRLGGDEFLLLFPAALPGDVVPPIREAFRRANELLPGDERARLEIQASLGAAEFSGLEDLSEAIRRADAAMYEEKAGHRAIRIPHLHVASRRPA